MNGYTKPYFQDDTGRVFRDETGFTDHGDPIPYEVELGNNNFNNDLHKNYIGAVVDAEAARTMQVMYSVDNGEWQRLGQVDEKVKEMTFPHNSRGRKIKYKFTHNDDGEPPKLNGISTFYSVEERLYGDTR